MAILKILLCDLDRNYVETLAKYMLGSRYGHRIEVIVHSNIDNFLDEKAYFHIGILGQEFKELERKCQIQTVFYLSEKNENGEEQETLFKYQSMDIFLGKVFRNQMGENSLSSVNDQKQEMIAILSPVFHEWRLPFAVSLCKVFSEVEEVLFLDMEQISIFQQVLGKEDEKNLLDFLYLMENRYGECNLRDFLSYYEGFSYLPPMSSPMELVEIKIRSWEQLLDKLYASGFSKIVFLFDGLIQGQEEIFHACSKIMILTQADEYGRLCSNHVSSYLQQYEKEEKLINIKLPLMNRKGGGHGFSLEAICREFMDAYVRKELNHRAV